MMARGFTVAVLLALGAATAAAQTVPSHPGPSRMGPMGGMPMGAAPPSMLGGPMPGGGPLVGGPLVGGSPLGSAPMALAPIARMPVAPPPPPSGALRVTTDTAEYCEVLVVYAVRAERSHPHAPVQAGELAEEGRLMCAAGKIRPGIYRLRRALLMLQNEP